MKHIKLFENYISDNFDFVNIEDLQIFVGKLCNSMGIRYTYIKLLAEGGNGAAIDLGDSILKLTFDISEAYIAVKLKDINSDSLVKIFDIKKIKSDRYGDFYAIHEEKLITHLNSVISNFLYYLHKRNPIINNLEYITDDEIYDFFKEKMVSLDKNNVMILFNKWKKVYDESKKYNIPFSDFHGKNVGVRKSNPTELVYFDISDPYEIYSNRELKIDTINIK